MFSTKSDVYSFGMVLYELITRGCIPFKGIFRLVLISTWFGKIWNLFYFAWIKKYNRKSCIKKYSSKSIKWKSHRCARTSIMRLCDRVGTTIRTRGPNSPNCTIFSSTMRNASRARNNSTNCAILTRARWNSCVVCSDCESKKENTKSPTNLDRCRIINSCLIFY